MDITAELRKIGLTYDQCSEVEELLKSITVKKDALDKVLEYSMPDERKSLEEHLYDEVDAEEDFDKMTDKELYEYCLTYNVNHIWMHLYILSI